MSQSGWRSNTPLIDWLQAEPYRFDFFQALLLLERARPDAVPLAAGSDPEREAVELAASIRLDFPPSDIESLTPAPNEAVPPRLQVNFFSLAGAEGPLPQPLVDIIQNRMRERDYAARDFLNLFHHRLLSLVFRGARAHRAALAAQAPEDSPTGNYLRAFAGLALPGQHGRLPVADRALVAYAGLLWQQPHSAAGLERLLTDYFGVRFAVRQMQGAWRPLPPEAWTRLGPRGRNQILGDGAVLGQRVWLQAAAAEVKSEPLTLAQFRDLLPGGAALAALRALARLYAGTLCALTICLELRADAAEPARLGSASLGWTSWLPRRGGAATAPPVRVRFALA
ncbi:MAG: type VI secretion system baseplate subunit TssG [Terriglobales bacterium]